MVEGAELLLAALLMVEAAAVLVVLPAVVLSALVHPVPVEEHSSAPAH